VTVAASTVPSQIFLYDLNTDQKKWDLVGMNPLKIGIILNDGLVVVGYLTYVDGIMASMMSILSDL
jgi:hypothetical protein